MPFPIHRPRRLRENPILRSLVRETEVFASDLIFPLFVTHGKNIRNPISSMPGIFQLSVDQLAKEVRELAELKIPAVILFGIPEKKDDHASSAYSKENPVIRAIAEIKNSVPEMLVITDVCLCAYTTHGHCGIGTPFQGKAAWRGGFCIDNDSTLEVLSKTAGAYARAGADVIAPSDMMDGRVQAIRDELDAAGYRELPILSYAVKYASSFYAPFRDAAESAPQFGDRCSYQMDPANVREAIQEAKLDLEEGADLLLVKPALPFLDVIKTLRDEFTTPIGAYQVSGEYSMIKAAAEKGWLDEKKVVQETLLSIKRAGADFIVTYFAKQAAGYLR